MVMERKFEPNVLEVKAFALMLFLAIARMIIYYLRSTLPLYFIPSSVGYGLFSVMITAYWFLLNPVLMFLAFYRVCGQNFPEKAGSSIVSFVAGSLAGQVIGGLIMSGVLSTTTEFGFISGLGILFSELEFGVGSDVLLALAAVASAWLVRKWDEMLLQAQPEWRFQRPFEISLASVLYVTFGILTLLVVPILGLFSLGLGRNPIDLWLTGGVVILLVISGLSQITIGYGVYKGKRWGWMVAFMISSIGLALNVILLTIFVLLPLPLEILGVAQIVATVISIVLDLIVIGLLLPFGSRQYCRMVNPRAVTQQSTV